MFWGGPAQITGPSLSRLRRLLEHDIAVYSSHIPLDKHQTLGNNVLLAKELGLIATGSFARYEGISIGVSGDTELKTMTLAERAERFSKAHGGATRVSSITQTRRTRKWGICTGAGASAETLDEALECGIDTLVVGEGAHWTAVFAEENDLAIIYAGHYATETLGVTALAQHLGEKFGIPWSFVSAPTGL
jgi:putative NIF3 family GTP cyclohydrolase 1 type 2